jgi:hypothetical protein
MIDNPDTSTFEAQKLFRDAMSKDRTISHNALAKIIENKYDDSSKVMAWLKRCGLLQRYYDIKNEVGVHP